MADIQVRIKLNAGVDGDLISSVAFNQETNNVSKVVGSKTTKNDGQNLISWGEKGLIHIDEDGRVGGAGTLGEQNGYNGFVFGVVPSNKQYSVEVTLEGSNIDSVTFYGDKNANQFPTRAIVNGEYIYSDDAEWTIIFPTSANSQTITFDMWNRGNYNACFTHIGVFVNELILDKRWIKSVETLSQSTGQPKEIYYGIIPSSGNVEILDINGEIKDYIQDGIIEVNDLKISIVANDKLVGVRDCETIDYDIESKEFSASLTDNVLFEDVISIALKDYTGQEYINLKTILENYIFGQSIDSMLTRKTIYTDYKNNIDIEMSIGEYLQKIKLKYLYIYNKSKKQILEYVCNIAQISLIKNTNGEWEFIPLRPKIIPNNVIRINKNCMFSNLKFDVVVYNKYNKVKTSPKSFSLNRENIYERTISLKEEDFSNAPYSVNAIGMGASIYKGVDVVSAYAKFFDKVYYSDSEFPLFNSSSIWSMVKTAQPADVLNTKPLSMSQNKVEDFNSSADIPNTYLGKIELLNYNANRDNNVPYDFAICMDLTPYNKLAGEGAYEYYNYDSVNISIIGEKYKINNTTLTFGDGNKEFEFQENPLITDTTFVGDDNTSISYVLAQNILNDYSNGIKTATCTLGCLNYYNLDNQLKINWDNGEIINVGDILNIETYNGLWRVTGVNFRKSGVPMVDIELQEVKYDVCYLQQTSYTTNQDYEMSSGNGQLGVTWYKTMNFDRTNGKVYLSDIAVKSDYVKGAVLYWASSETTTEFTKIELTSDLDNSSELKCTAHTSTYKVKQVLV